MSPFLRAKGHLTDIAKFQSDEPNIVIGDWMRNRNTIDYLGWGNLL